MAGLINLPEAQVERKLSQMILDNNVRCLHVSTYVCGGRIVIPSHSSYTTTTKQILGTLDQGRGQLLVYEPSAKDKTFEHGLDIIASLGLVVDSLFRRAQRLASHGHVVSGGASAPAAPAPAASS